MEMEDRRELIKLTVQEIWISRANEVKLTFAVPVNPSRCFESPQAEPGGRGGDERVRPYQDLLRPGQVREIVRCFRDEGGVTQTELGRRLNVGTRSVERWARGTVDVRPTSENLARLLLLGKELELSLVIDLLGQLDASSDLFDTPY